MNDSLNDPPHAPPSLPAGTELTTATVESVDQNGGARALDQDPRARREGADMPSPVKLERAMKQRHGAGGFRIEILHPGRALGAGDSGVGAIGRIDHARVTPGTVIRMHPHRDDEILTYLRTGRVRHSDNVGDVEEISSQRLMMMNAGHTFEHEETVLDSGVLTGLQIFLRPSAGDLEPRVQFHQFDQIANEGEWRLLAGPAGQAPLEVRAQAWVHDTHLKAGQELDLPPAPATRSARLLYMFAGKGHAAGVSLSEGESVLLNGTRHRVSADNDSDLVLFTTDLSAAVFKGGMFSGNILARR